MVQRYQNQNYSALKSSCAKIGTLFEDPYFPPTNDSLTYSKQPTQSVVWKRPKDINEDAQLFVDGASSADVTQGQVS